MNTTLSILILCLLSHLTSYCWYSINFYGWKFLQRVFLCPSIQLKWQGLFWESYNCCRLWTWWWNLGEWRSIQARRIQLELFTFIAYFSPLSHRNENTTCEWDDGEKYIIKINHSNWNLPTSAQNMIFKRGIQCTVLFDQVPGHDCIKWKNYIFFLGWNFWL